MNQTIKGCAFVLGCISAFIAGPAMAHAGVDTQSSELQWRLSSPAIEFSEAPAADETLPLSLDSWGAEPSLSPSALLPQQRMATKTPFIDWGKAEIGGFVGAVAYSSDFEANPNVMGGITGRVPVPGIPGNWGIWTALDIAGLNRDLPYFYAHKDGVWYSGNIGADYTFTDGDVFLLRAQAGVTYNYWNGIQGLDNNFAGTVGLDIGFYWVKFNHRTTFNLNPQITMCGSNWYAILGLEFQVQF